MVKIRKNDQVLIISGKDRTKSGKVLNVLPKEGLVLVEGMNLRKKHVKPKRQGEKGQIVQVSAPIRVSNIKIICPKCKKAARIGYKVADGGKKYRICKKCNQEI